ncbi:MAG: hypothetical protein ACKVP2_00200 [Burkholderiales bacterium]
MESSGACCPVNGGYSTGTRCADRDRKSAITSRMIVKPGKFATLTGTAAALLVALCTPVTLRADLASAAHGDSVEAEFRGCDMAGRCLFSVESSLMPGETLLRVHPNGVLQPDDDVLAALALRDRLNALLANMIHQVKRIGLHDLRVQPDGTFAATVTVHGVDIGTDSTLVALRAKKIRRPKPPD